MNRISIAVGIVLACANVAKPELLLVSLADEDRIAIYDLDSESGTLSHRGDVQVAGDPGAMCVDPKSQYVFLSLRKKGQIASLRIDRKTPSLVPLGLIEADADPAYLATDKTGRYLLSAYYVAGRVAVHDIFADGQLASAGRWYDTDEKAHAILTDKTNRWALVPHTGPNAVFLFSFDATVGVLKANDPAIVHTGELTGPRHLAFHPSSPFVYADNEQGSSVTAFRFDKERGTIVAFQTLSTLPDGYHESNTCAHMELAPGGKYLYTANRGHDSIAAFKISSRGEMQRVGIYPTEKTPRSFNIDSTGRFLVAAGQNSDTLVCYRVDPSSGALSAIRKYPTGKKPWWVQFAISK